MFIRGGDWEADIYDQTVVMSPYLLAFVISQFTFKEHTTPRGTKVSVLLKLRYYSIVDYITRIKHSSNTTVT